MVFVKSISMTVFSTVGTSGKQRPMLYCDLVKPLKHVKPLPGETARTLRGATP